MFDLNQTHHAAITSPNGCSGSRAVARDNMVKHGLLVQLVDGRFVRTPAGAYLLAAYNAGLIR